RPSLGVFPSPAGSPGFGSDTRTAPEEAAVLTLGSLWESVPSKRATKGGTRVPSPSPSEVTAACWSDLLPASAAGALHRPAAEFPAEDRRWMEEALHLARAD